MCGESGYEASKGREDAMERVIRISLVTTLILAAFLAASPFHSSVRAAALQRKCMQNRRMLSRAFNGCQRTLLQKPGDFGPKC